MAKYRLFRDYDIGYWIENTTETHEPRRHVIIDLDETEAQDIMNTRNKHEEYENLLSRKWRNS